MIRSTIAWLYQKLAALVTRHPKPVAAAVVLALITWLLVSLYQWQPERQVARHFDDWVQAVEDRKWKRIEGMFHDDYSDPWGFDKATVLREAREAMRHFFAPVVTAHEVAIQVDETTGEVRCRLTIDGDGTTVAGLIRHELNSRRPVFVLHWERTDWRPWHWQIKRIESEDISLHRYRGF